MIDTPSIPPVSVTSSAQKEANLDQQAIIKIPKSLNLLKAGEIVDAVVIRKENANNSIIKITSNNIEDGELPVVGKANLKKGSVLKLEILPSPDKTQGQKVGSEFNFQARIQSIDGKLIDNKNSLNSFDIIKAVIPQNIRPQAGSVSGGGQSLGSQALSGQASAGQGSGGVGLGESAKAASSQQASSVSGKSSIVNLSKGTFFTGSILNPSKGNEAYLPQSSSAQGSALGSVNKLNSTDQVTFHIVSISNKVDSSKAGGVDTNVTGGKNLSDTNLGVKSDSINKGQQQDPNLLPKGNFSASSSVASEKNVSHNKAIDAYNKQVSPTKASGNAPVSTSEALKSFASRSQILSAGAGNSAASATAVTSNKQFPASVLGVDKSGETILTTSLGTVKLASSIKIPSSSDLILEIVKYNSLVNKPSGLTIDDEPTKLITSLSSVKNIFNDFQGELENINRDINLNLSERIFPKVPTSELGAKLFLTKSLWFISNIFNVSSNSWLGDKVVDLLKDKGKADSLQRLDKAFGQLKTLLSDQNYSGWNNFLVPVYDGEKLNYMNFYTRRDKKDNNKSGENIRFLVEVELDKMGDIQIDGIVNTKKIEGSGKEINLDIVIKSHKEFSNEVKNDITNIYNNLGRINNIDNSADANSSENPWSLKFKTESDFSVKPYSDGNEDTGSITI